MKNTGKYNVYHGVVAVGRWVLFAVVAFLILFPVYWIFISSITPSGELFKTPIDTECRTAFKDRKYSSDRRHYTCDHYRAVCNGCLWLLKI